MPWARSNRSACETADSLVSVSCGEVADARLVLSTQVHENAQTRGVREHVEELGHDDDVLVDAHARVVTMLRGLSLGSWHHTRISEQVLR